MVSTTTALKISWKVKVKLRQTNKATSDKKDLGQTLGNIH